MPTIVSRLKVLPLKVFGNHIPVNNIHSQNNDKFMPKTDLMANTKLNFIELLLRID